MEVNRNGVIEGDQRKLENGNIEKRNDSYEFEDACEFIGFGRFHYGFIVCCGVSLIGVSMESLGTGYILQAAQCDFDLTQNEKALLSSAIFIGIVSSSLLWGYLADTKGRRGIMMPAALMATICSVLSSLSPNGWTFIILRVLTGFFVSSWSACIYAYVGEMHTNSKRSGAIVSFSLFIALGLTLLPAIGWPILNGEWEIPIPFLGIKYSPWRLYIGLCSLPNIIFFLSLLKYPESPKYLYASGRVDEALDVLKNIYAINTGRSKDEFPVKEIKCHELNNDDKSFCNSIMKQTVPLFQMPLLPCTALACLNHFTIFALSNSFYLWFPVMLNNLQSRTSEQPATVCEIMADDFGSITGTNNDFGMNRTIILGEKACQHQTPELISQIGLIMGIIFSVNYTIVGIAVNKVEKKILLGCLLGIPACCTLALYWVANDYLIVLLLVLLMCSGSGGGVISAIAVDLFPTKLRGMAICISLMFGRIGAVVASNLFGIMLVDNCSNIFIVFGVETFICFGTVMLWPKPKVIREKLAKLGIMFT